MAKERKPKKPKKPFDVDKWLISQLRRLSLKYPPAIKAINKTKEVYYIPSKKGKPMKRVKFTCASCGACDLKRSEMELDHKIPVVDPKVGFVDLITFIYRLFCKEDNLWLICKNPCHYNKSQLENSIRREV